MMSSNAKPIRPALVKSPVFHIPMPFPVVVIHNPLKHLPFDHASLTGKEFTILPGHHEFRIKESHGGVLHRKGLL